MVAGRKVIAEAGAVPEVETYRGEPYGVRVLLAPVLLQPVVRHRPLREHRRLVVEWQDPLQERPASGL